MSAVATCRVQTGMPCARSTIREDARRHDYHALLVGKGVGIENKELSDGIATPLLSLLIRNSARSVKTLR